MHDAAEALGIGDMLSPLKRDMPRYQELETKLNEIIAKKYRFKPGFTKEPYLKLVDRALALAESRDLLLHKGGENWWSSWKTPEAIKIMNKIPKIYPWIPREAKERFLARAHQLGLS